MPTMPDTCLDIPERLHRLRDILLALGSEPPNVLLLEGGTVAERETLALYWASRLNCPADNAPCLCCPECLQVAALAFRDIHFLDGKEGSVTIDQVREVRTVMGQPPRGSGRRVIIISQAQNLTTEASNGLLKSLEEPLPGNVFVLLVPQRAWLLPTLVSRSWAFALGWGEKDETAAAEMLDWEERLVDFWQTGKGLFQHTAAKGTVDQALVNQILATCQRAVAGALTGQGGSLIGRYWQDRMRPATLLKVNNLLSKGMEALQRQVNPSLVLDWVALTVWKWQQEAQG